MAKKSLSTESIPHVRASDFRRTKSCASLNSPVQTPCTPEGKKRCGTCDQLFAVQKMRCPHCKASDDVILDVKLEYDPTKQEEFWGAFDKEVKRLHKLLPNSRNELVAFLFKNAMDVRYEHPKRSHQLFHEVIALKPQHWESRIKLSWLKFGSTTSSISFLFLILSSLLHLPLPSNKNNARITTLCALISFVILPTLFPLKNSRKKELIWSPLEM